MNGTKTDLSVQFSSLYETLYIHIINTQGPQRLKNKGREANQLGIKQMD